MKIGDYRLTTHQGSSSCIRVGLIKERIAEADKLGKDGKVVRRKGEKYEIDDFVGYFSKIEEALKGVLRHASISSIGSDPENALRKLSELRSAIDELLPRYEKLFDFQNGGVND